MPKLLIQEGGQQSVFELFDDDVTVGRGAANAVQVADPRASKHHAVVRRVQGRPKLVDLESRNGTRVNGEFRNQRWLEHGDVVSIGEMTMTYDASDVPAAPAAAPPRAHAAPAVAPAAPRPVPVAVTRRPVGTHARPGHARAREEAEGHEHGPRVVPRRRDNSVAIAVLVGAGLIGAVFLLFQLMSSGGRGANAAALAEAKRISAAGDTPAAIAYLERNSDPGDVDGYKSVEEQLKEWKTVVEDKDRQDREKAAKDALYKIHKDFVEQHKNGLTDLQIGQALLEWIEKYDGTVKGMELTNSQVAPYPRFRELMEQARNKK